ncbi:phospholipase-like protein [Tanacetum coccineum]
MLLMNSRKASGATGAWDSLVWERDQLIGELDNCLGSTTATKSTKLWREMNDADLAKTRWLDLAYFDHEAHMLDYMLQKQCRVNDSHNDMQLTYYVNGRSLHFGRQKFSLITLFRFGAVSFSCYSKGDMKFKDRVFPHRVGLTITSLDLLSVIEDEEYFRKLCDVDSICVCLLLCLEVIFMGRLMVNEVDDTLMRLVDSLESWNAFPWESFERSNRWWNKVAEAIPRGIGWSKKPIFKRSDYCTLFCKESNPISDLRPTLAEYKSEWWTSTIDFLQVYVPRTPIRKPDLFDEYLQKMSVGRKRNRLCRHISTPITNVPRSKISSVKDSIIKRLNSRIFKLKAIIQVLGRERNSDVVEKLKFSEEFCQLSVEFCDELNHDFLELFESSIIDILGTPLDVDTHKEFDEERALEVKKRWDEDYRKRSYAFMNSDHMKQAMARCSPKKISHSLAVRTNSWLQMWHVRPNDANWAMVSNYFVQLLLQNAMPLWYVNGDRYSIAWTEVDKVFIPFNEPGQHWSLAEFDIMYGVVTFYDSCDSYDLKCRDWYIRTRDCLQVRLREVLELVNVFDKKGIDKTGDDNYAESVTNPLVGFGNLIQHEIFVSCSDLH